MSTYAPPPAQGPGTFGTSVPPVSAQASAQPAGATPPPGAVPTETIPPPGFNSTRVTGLDGEGTFGPDAMHLWDGPQGQQPGAEGADQWRTSAPGSNFSLGADPWRTSAPGQQVGAGGADQWRTSAPGASGAYGFHGASGNAGAGFRTQPGRPGTPGYGTPGYGTVDPSTLLPNNDYFGGFEPSADKIALLQPPKKGVAGKWAGSELPDLLLPWVLFTMVLLSWGLAYHRLMPLCWIALLLGVALSSYLFLRSKGVPWKILSFFCAFAILVGWAGGYYIFDKYLGAYYIYKRLPHYQNIVPTIDPAVLRDAGVIDFSIDSFVDQSHSSGFKNGELFCAAPIVANLTQTTVAGFWAVGTDCCGARGTFWCDESTSKVVHSGLVVLRESMAWSTEYYKAVQQAGAVYGMAVPQDPVFVQWTARKSVVTEEMWYAAITFCLLAVLLFFLCPLLVVALQVATSREMLKSVPEAVAKDWEWHPSEASQMIFAYSRNSDFPAELRYDLASDRAYWSGEILHDYVFHVANSNLFISPVACHPAQIFNKIQRFGLLVMTCVLLTFSTAAVEALSGDDGLTQCLAPMLVLGVVHLSRGYLLRHIRMIAKRDMDLQVIGSSDAKVDNVNKIQTGFFVGFSVGTLLLCILSVAVIMAKGLMLGPSLQRGLTGLAYGFVLDLCIDLVCPRIFAADDERHELRGKAYAGYFSRWWLERASYMNVPKLFLWREAVLHPRLAPKKV